jgi:hypothetical protein
MNEPFEPTDDEVASLLAADQMRADLDAASLLATITGGDTDEA